MTQPVGDIIIVTGMTGAGRSTAAKALEDLGWFVIDNLPPQLLGATVSLIGREEDDLTARIAVVVDVRSRGFFADLTGAMEAMRRDGIASRLLFLEATDEVLVRRQEAARRPHPLQGGGRLLDGIMREREMLADLRGEADVIIDTSDLNVHQLATKVSVGFSGGETPTVGVTLVSFGFKYGIPVDASMVVDMRFLPNPHWDLELRPMSGLDAPVSDFVLGQPEADVFLSKLEGLLDTVTPGFLRERKYLVTLAVGCTGGKHRSVAMSEEIARRLRSAGTKTLVVHRDLGRE